ncbi:pseudouridine synthase [Besnoitia besnoiti]|uniref:tRNA pseudouridine synthase n=1 Tax=Besnoitia besnoiti TaxID=94643 RepID=A0A2A9M110_BESBE|nr:pseudouridine synthase [Besnoitia besnoiti]PFH32238.1 pseudouridine synthase [Besnoitia besnoiti]
MECSPAETAPAVSAPPPSPAAATAPSGGSREDVSSAISSSPLHASVRPSREASEASPAAALPSAALPDARGDAEATCEQEGNRDRCKASKKPKRAFNWDGVPTGHFLLKFAYDGSAYSGVAFQGEGSGVRTVEDALFEALEKTCLIRDRNSCNFSRCGRTDKGVHAAGNCISITLRVKEPSKRLYPEENYDYVAVLNAVLPGDIRILASAPVPAGFDARFDCTGRVYKYFFHSAGLDLARMHRAAQCFIGEHNFRYFCKLDPRQYRCPRRTLTSFRVEPAGDGACAVATIAGRSFLWHQVRFMMAALMKVGRGECGEDFIVSLLQRGAEEEKEEENGEAPERIEDTDAQEASKPGAPGCAVAHGHCEGAPGGAGASSKKEKVKVKTFSAGLAPAAAGCLVLFNCLFDGVQWDGVQPCTPSGEDPSATQGEATAERRAATTQREKKRKLEPRETFQNQYRKALERVQVLKCLGGIS